MSILSLIPEEKKKCLQSNSESVYSSNSLKFPCALHRRKILHPLLSSTSMVTMANSTNRSGDKFVTKRVLSAKEHRVKQLQNQLADAHFHLSELSNENRLLRNLQKRQDSALQRYESANGDIPKLINSHTEEIRSWQVRYKQLKVQFREVAQKLKDKDFELQQLNDEHKHLLTLSKDANLVEREKLQNQVSELTDKVQKQNETISTLQRRILLEEKNHKRQLNIEILKHKEAQQQLADALAHSDQLSTVFELKEKNISLTNQKKMFPKINLGNANSRTSLNSLNLDVMNKRNGASSNFSFKGNSSSESHVSSEGNIKSSRSTGSTFSVVGKSMHFNENTNQENLDSQVEQNQTKDDNESNIIGNVITTEYDLALAIKNGMPNVKIFESDTDIPRSSDEEVQVRVENMKKQVRNQLTQSDDSDTSLEKNGGVTFRNVRKNSQGNGSVTSEDSISANISFSSKKSSRNQKHNIYNSIGSLSKMNAENEIGLECEINLKPLDDYNKVLQDIDTKTVIFNSTDELNSDFDKEISKGFEELDSDIKMYQENFLKKQNMELNNNTIVARKVSSELNSEKKKKLLAALKAIDRGEEQGLLFDASKKYNKPYKSSKNIVNN